MRKEHFQYGFTTGSCAAGAAKGAAYGLLQGTIPEYVKINTPAGIPLRLRPIYHRIGQGFSECAIRKYSGDDPDVTNGCKIYVRIERSESACPNDSFPPERHGQTIRQGVIRFMGGEGVGMVTSPGLQVTQGEPAINPVPRLMIKKAIKEVMDDCKGLNVIIAVPDGKKLAEKTFNKRLGIIGGISIIGTTGIVKPMSLDSFKTSLMCGLDVAKASGHEAIALVPGGIGEKGFLKHYNVSRYQVIQMSNFVGFMLEEALKRDFKQIMLAGHPGKLAKLIRGDFYTHSSRSKTANDLLINIFRKEQLNSKLIDNLNNSSTVEGMIEILKKHGELHIFDCVADEIQFSANRFISAKAKTGVTLFDMKKNIIGVSKGFKEWQRNSQTK